MDEQSTKPSTCNNELQEKCNGREWLIEVVPLQTPNLTTTLKMFPVKFACVANVPVHRGFLHSGHA